MEQYLNYISPEGLWGIAIDYTRIDKEGKMWVGNGEYETQVNYCPFTGTQAPKQMKVEYHEKYKIYKNEQN
jgi:hypothetical protein